MHAAQEFTPASILPQRTNIPDSQLGDCLIDFGEDQVISTRRLGTTMPLRIAGKNFQFARAFSTAEKSRRREPDDFKRVTSAIAPRAFTEISRTVPPCVPSCSDKPELLQQKSRGEPCTNQAKIEMIDMAKKKKPTIIKALAKITYFASGGSLRTLYRDVNIKNRTKRRPLAGELFQIVGCPCLSQVS